MGERNKEENVVKNEANATNDQEVETTVVAENEAGQEYWEEYGNEYYQDGFYNDVVTKKIPVDPSKLHKSLADGRVTEILPTDPDKLQFVYAYDDKEPHYNKNSVEEILMNEYEEGIENKDHEAEVTETGNTLQNIKEFINTDPIGIKNDEYTTGTFDNTESGSKIDITETPIQVDTKNPSTLEASRPESEDQNKEISKAFTDYLYSTNAKTLTTVLDGKTSKTKQPELKSETGNEYDEAEAAESDENMNGIANALSRMGDSNFDYYDGYDYEVDDNLDDDENKFKVNNDEIEFNDDYDYYDADVKNENNAEDGDSEEESIENFHESDNIKSRSVKSKKKNRRIQSKILNRKL